MKTKRNEDRSKWKRNKRKTMSANRWSAVGGAWCHGDLPSWFLFFSFLFFSFLFLLLLLYFLGAFFSLSSLVVVALRPQNSVRSSLPIFFLRPTYYYLVVPSFLPSFGCCWYLVFRNWDSLERALPRFNCSPVSTCLNVLLPRFTSFYPVLPSFT